MKDPWSETGEEMPKDETLYCEAIVVPGMNYLRNGDPGYPEERCDEEALPDSSYCADHHHLEEPEYESFDADEAYKRMKMGDDY